MIAVESINADDGPDTIATLAELTRIGIPAAKLKVVFNQVDDDASIRETFDPACLHRGDPAYPGEPAVPARRQRDLRAGQGTGTCLAELASDPTDYKALIAQARDKAEKVAWAQRLATRRLASGVVPELDGCFAAIDLR